LKPFSVFVQQQQQQPSLIPLMHCLDMRQKQNSRVPRQFCRENNKATKCSISANVRFFTSHRYIKHMLSGVGYMDQITP